MLGDVAHERVGRCGRRAPRFRVEVEHRVDDRRAAGRRVVDDVRDGAGLRIEESLRGARGHGRPPFSAKYRQSARRASIAASPVCADSRDTSRHRAMARGELTMTIDWNAFTPWSALGGGLLIGIGVAMLLLVDGRIAGISGVVGGLLRPRAGDVGWRIAFVAGLVVAPLVAALAGQSMVPNIDASFVIVALAGVAVGIGTRYGAGCTSGHGICGVARLSPRSLVATATFMAAGFATVFIVRHVLGA